MEFQKIQIDLHTPPVWRTRSSQFPRFPGQTTSRKDLQEKFKLTQISKNLEPRRWFTEENAISMNPTGSGESWTVKIRFWRESDRGDGVPEPSGLSCTLASLSLYEFIPNCWETQNPYGYCCRFEWSISMFLWLPISLHKNSSSIRNFLHTDLSSSLLYFLNN